LSFNRKMVRSQLALLRSSREDTSAIASRGIVVY
jgi:hypothetical protein